MNIQWLLTGEGDMLRDPDAPAPAPAETRPFIPVHVASAAAGVLDGFPSSADLNLCEFHPFVPSFGAYDFSMVITGDSMEPEFRHGDEIALRAVEPGNITPGAIYVVDAEDGALVKRVYVDGHDLLCHSINALYAPVRVPQERVRALYRVRGVLRPL